MRTLLLAALIAAPAYSQTNLDRESQDKSRRGALEQKAAEAAEAARASESPDEVAFAQVLKAPGDIDLNERYAREQIRRGDLRGAATTLERVLILAPGRDRTRLLYGAVLYRLDALVDAERELRVVIGRLAAPEVIAEANKYLSYIEARKRRFHFETRLSLGFGYDDNRNAASETGMALFAGNPVVLNAASRAKEDTNIAFAGSLGGSYEFGGAKPQKVFANASYYRGEQTVIDTLDLQAYSGVGGLALRAFGYDITPYGGFDHVLLNQATYLRNANGGLRVARKVLPRLELWGEARLDDQRFVRSRYVPSAEDRTGRQYDYSLGATWVASPRDRFALTALHRRKYARAVSWAHRRESIAMDYTRLLGRGTFLNLGVTGQFDRYDRPDTAISSQGRADDAVVARVLYGAPLSLLWSPLEDFMGTLGYERFQQYSNLLNYTYSNNRLSAMISYKWGI